LRTTNFFLNIYPCLSPSVMSSSPLVARHGHKAIPFSITEKSSVFVKNQFKELLDTRRSVRAVLLLWGGDYGIIDTLTVHTLDPPTWRTITTQGITPTPSAGFCADVHNTEENETLYVFGGIQETDLFDTFSNNVRTATLNVSGSHLRKKLTLPTRFV